MEPKSIRTTAKPLCLLCNSPGTIIHENLRDVLFGAPGSWNLRKCTQGNCGLVWPDPFPIAEDIHLAYSSYYTHSSDPGSARSLRDVFYGIYRSVQRLPAYICGLRKQQVDLEFMFLREMKPGRVLDVGCGDGKFLNKMRQRGWEVEGFDFDAEAIRTAKEKYGLNLEHADIETVLSRGPVFDAITLNHVIEHVPDPVKLLLQCKGLLKPGGRITVVTPNIDSLGHARFGSSWRGLEPPRHLHIFSPKTLAAIAAKAALRVCIAESTAANADVIIGASYSIQFAKNPPGAVLEPNFSFFRTVKAVIGQYREHLDRRPGNECGEEAILVCEKLVKP